MEKGKANIIETLYSTGISVGGLKRTNKVKNQKRRSIIIIHYIHGYSSSGKGTRGTGGSS